MCIQIFLIVYSFLFIFVDSTLINQSQSGDLNVQVDLKGLHIIALMKGGKEEYVDYDYAYDYSEMTIKPHNRTTPSPINITSTTSKPEAVENNAATVILEITTAAMHASDIAGVTLDQTVTHDNSTSNSTVSYNVTEPPTLAQNTTVLTTSITTSNTTTKPTICRKGFVLNSKGDCDLKLQGTGNALLKLVKLSQKLKLRRENKSGNADAE